MLTLVRSAVVASAAFAAQGARGAGGWVAYLAENAGLYSVVLTVTGLLVAAYKGAQVGAGASKSKLNQGTADVRTELGCKLEKIPTELKQSTADLKTELGDVLDDVLRAVQMLSVDGARLLEMVEVL